MSNAVQNTRWYAALLTPQAVVYLIGAMVAVTVFWTKTEGSWEKQKATEDRVNRQYEQMNKLSDKITTLEKQAEYERGFRDGQNKKPSP